MVENNKDFLMNLTLNQLEDWFVSIGHQKFRASQLFNQIYQNKKTDFTSIANIPDSLRHKLTDEFEIQALELIKIRESSDGSRKLLFELKSKRKVDAAYIESVIIPSFSENSPDRITLCASTQLGCPANCLFCATGKLGYSGNLLPAEIVGQFTKAQEITGGKISNIVFMGMGEPLLNFKNLLDSLKILTEPKGLNFSPRRITVSTIGITDRIIQLADSGFKTKLALSLHSTDEEIRNKLIPLSKKYPLKDILSSLDYYYKKTRHRLTLEYILFEGVNDTLDDAEELAEFSKRIPSKINIIPYNDISFTLNGSEIGLRGTSHIQKKIFIDYLRELKFDVFERTSAGSDIEAACGQLAFSEKQIKL